MSRKKNFLAVRDGIPKLEFDTTLDFLIIEYTIVPWIDTELLLKWLSQELYSQLNSSFKINNAFAENRSKMEKL